MSAAAHDDTAWPPILTDAPYAIDIEFYGADTSSPMVFGDEATFNLVLSPMGRARPTADQVYELTSDDGILRPADHIVSIVPSLDEVSTWSPGLYEVELRQFAAGVATAAIYTGTVLVERGLSDRAELGGGRPLEAGGAATVQVFNRVRVLRGAAGGAAGLALGYANAAQASAATATTQAVISTTKAGEAAASAASATTQAGVSTTKAGEAAASAATATTQAGISTTKAGEAAASAATATTQAGISTTKAGEAAASAATATTQAGISTTKAGEAAASAATATTQAGISTTQAGIATTKAGEAAASAVATAADRVQTALDRVQTGADKSAADGSAAAAAASAATAASAALNILERVALADPTATLAQNTGNVIRGVENLPARSTGQTYFRVGLVSSTALTSVATVTRASAATAVDQSGVVWNYAAGVPRVTTAGLLLEEAATNLNQSSQDFTSAWWTRGNLAATANATTAPDGTLTADKLTENTAVFNWHAAYHAFTGLTNGQAYTHTCYLKAAERTWAMVEIDDYAGGRRAWFDLANGKVGTVEGGVTATIEPAAQGFYRCRVTKTIAGTSAGPGIYPASADNVLSYAGTVGWGIYAWQSDFVASANPSSPIPTPVGATASRAADVVSETVSVPVGQAFTVTGRAIAPPSAGGNFYVFDLIPASGTADRLAAWISGGTFFITAAAGSLGAIVNQSIFNDVPLGFAAAYDGANTVTLSTNGKAVTTLTIPGGAFAQALTRLFLGCQNTGVQQVNTAIRDFNLIPRAYSNAELQAASDVSLTHDVDFIAKTYRYAGDPYLAVTDLPVTTFTRASGGYAPKANGTLVWFAAGALRITDAGILLEPSGATNLFLRSQELGNAAWARTNGGTGTAPVVTDNFAAAPDGTQTASRIQATQGAGGSAADYSLLYNQVGTVTSFQYTKSIWLKSNTGSPQNVLIYDSNAQVGTVCAVTTAWQRFSITGIATVSPQLIVGTRGGSGQFFNGGDPTFDILAWGGQVEAGTVATSYVPTTSATATRAGDQLRSSEVAPAAFSVLAEFVVPATAGGLVAVWTWDDGTTNNRVMVYCDTAPAVYVVVNTGGVAQASLSLGAVAIGATCKVAVRVAANDFAASKNGAACVTDASGTVPAVSTFRHGALVGSSGGVISKRLRRYSVAKTNAELQALAA